MSNGNNSRIIQPERRRVMPIVPKSFHIGGVETVAPEDPMVISQLEPGILQNAAKFTQFLTALLNQSAALIREVNRLREHAGLPPWTGGVTPPEFADPDEESEAEAEQADADAEE